MPMSLSLDLRAALRGLIRDRAFTAFSILALALGLGLNGALLVLSRTFLLRPAPVARPESLLELKDVFKGKSPLEARGSTTLFQVAQGLPALVDVAAAGDSFTKSWNQGPLLKPVEVMEVHSSYLPLLGIQPYLGRAFEPGEDGAGEPRRLALLSHRFWTSNLGGRKETLGSLLHLEGQAYTVVGVLPPGFHGHALDQPADILVPFAYDTVPPSATFRLLATVLARLKPGVNPAQLKAALDAQPWGGDMHPEVRPYAPLPPLLRQRLARGLAGLHAAAFLILGIGLANVLALQTARLQRRRPELAMRAALGAGGQQLFRLVLMENLLLAALAGAAALLLAAVSAPFLDAVRALLPYPAEARVAFGGWPALATFALALLLGLLLAGLVHLQARRLDLGSPLKEAGAHTSGTRVRSLLVAAQAALALVLLCSASLCLQDLRRQLDIPLGMDIRNRYLLECQPEKVGRKGSELAPLTPVLHERLQALPGVQGVALSQGAPVKGFSMVMIQPFGACYYTAATPNLTSLMGIPVKTGRPLEPGDVEAGRILVSESFALKAWPEGPAVGRRWRARGQEREVVGVVPDVLFGGPKGRSMPFAIAAASYQDALLKATLANFTIQVQGSPRQARAALQATARAELQDIPFRLRSLEQIRDEALEQPRQLLFLSSVMGSLALILSLCGLYGLAAHLAQSRRQEVGIRVVLGAGPLRVLGSLARRTLLPVLPGLAAGALLAAGTSRLLVHQGEAFPVLSTPLVLGSALVLAIAAALATLFPALRAAFAPPAAALRTE